MEINGIKIKKYRARVKASDTFTTAPVEVSADGYKVVEGYVSIAAVVIPYEGNTPQYVPVFVAEEVDVHRMGASGFGKSVFNPVTYAEGDFELIDEIEGDNNMESLTLEKEKELEAFIEYLDEINHKFGEGAKVKAGSPIELKVGERVLSLPLNSDTFNMVFDAVYNLLHG